MQANFNSLPKQIKEREDKQNLASKIISYLSTISTIYSTYIYIYIYSTIRLLHYSYL